MKANHRLSGQRMTSVTCSSRSSGMRSAATTAGFHKGRANRACTSPFGTHPGRIFHRQTGSAVISFHQATPRGQPASIRRRQLSAFWPSGTNHFNSTGIELALRRQVRSSALGQRLDESRTVKHLNQGERMVIKPALAADQPDVLLMNAFAFYGKISWPDGRKLLAGVPTLFRAVNVTTHLLHTNLYILASFMISVWAKFQSGPGSRHG